MTVMEPITIGQAEPKAREITREEAIRDVFVSSPTAVAVSVYLSVVVLVLRERTQADDDLLSAWIVTDIQG
jgi:hypothetical protein